MRSTHLASSCRMSLSSLIEPAPSTKDAITAGCQLLFCYAAAINHSVPSVLDPRGKILPEEDAGSDAENNK